MNVHHGDGDHLVRMVTGQTMSDAPAPIMAHDVEPLKSEMSHHIDLIQRHRPFGIVLVILAAVGHVAVPVASEIGCDDGIFRNNFV